jgi:ABC-type glycerol-3-phosphate transport system substrate-binding protein
MVGYSARGSGGGSQDEAPDRLAFEGRTLRMALKEGYELDAIKTFKGDFEQATGTQVSIEVYDEPTTRQKFILDAASEIGNYDVTSVSFWHLPEYQRAGYLEPLGPYIENARDPWLNPDAIPERATAVLSVDGALYALPHTLIGGMFFYRKDLFEEHGIDTPQTTDDILSAAQQLKEAEPSIESPFTGRGAPTFASLGTWIGWTWGYGARLLDEGNCPQATDATFTEGASDLMTLMRDYGPQDAAALTFTQAGEKFASGNAAMMFDTTGFGIVFGNPELSKAAGNVGYTLPTGPAGNYLQWPYIEGLGISKYSHNKELAWLFLQWRMSEETTSKEVEELGRLDVPNLDVIRSDMYTEQAEQKGLTDYAEMLPQAWDNITLEHWPFVREFARIADTYMQQTSSAIAGQQTTEEALERVQDKLEVVAKDAGYC